MWRLLFLGVVPAASVGLTLDLDGVSHTHSDKSLYAVNPDGSTKWVFNADVYGKGPHAEGLNNTVLTTQRWNGSSTLFSLHGADGSIMWKHDMRSGDVSGLSVAKDGTAYVTSYSYGRRPCSKCEAPISNTTVHAITPTGAEKWTFGCPGRADLSDVAPDGTLFLGVTQARGRELVPDWFALQPDTGAVKWSVVSELGNSELSVHGPHVFWVVQGYQDSSVNSLNKEDGKILWSHPFQSCNDLSNHLTVGHNDELYVSGIAHPLVPCSYGVFAFNGTNLRNLPCAFESHLEALPCDPAAYSHDEDVFVSYSDTNVLAFSGTDGSIAWRVPEPHLNSQTEARFSFGQDGTIFVGQFDELPAGASVYEYQDTRRSSQTSAIRNAEIIWKVQTHGVLEPLMLEDGTTYVDGWQGNREVELVAFGADGFEKWRFRPTSRSVKEKAEAIEIVV